MRDYDVIDPNPKAQMYKEMTTGYKIHKLEKEINRLQAIEQALIDFKADMLPSKAYTANHVYDWIHSTTSYKGME